MADADRATCPRWGAAFSADDPAGFCPRSLLTDGPGGSRGLGASMGSVNSLNRRKPAGVLGQKGAPTSPQRLRGVRYRICRRFRHGPVDKVVPWERGLDTASGLPS
jgi:hypothetical protein